MASLMRQRDSTLVAAIERSVQTFVNNGIMTRRCAACDRTFKAHSRWNFLCSDSCRNDWYRGSFHPHSNSHSKVKRRRKAA